MVGIVTGNELGLDTTSLAKLGSQGVLGNASHGRNGERVFVNATTGNVIVQQRDEIRVGLGPDAELLRTYNSQGMLSDDPDAQDNWLQGWSKCVFDLNGTLNTQGSSVMRRDAQGALVRYSYIGSLEYATALGEGAQDTLYYSTSTDTWIWTEGITRVKETYAADSGCWRIVSRADANGNTLRYSYDAQGRLASLSSAGGERIELDYQNGRLTQVRSLGLGSTQSTRTRYAYDTAGRLSEVVVDLSPEDNNIVDGKVYVTRYTYEGESTRIASITQSDGTRVAFAYTLSADGVHRLSQVCEDPQGLNRLTTLSYDLAARTTSVRDASGATSVLAYDGAGRLLSVQAQSVDGISRRATHRYDSYGHLAGTTDAYDRLTTYVNDTRGNRTLERDALGNTVTRLYNGVGQVLMETCYLTPDPDGAGSKPATDLRSTRYVYDGNFGIRLRFVVGPEGQVTEHRYDAQGQRVRSAVYLDARYDVSTLSSTSALSETTLVSWSIIQDASRVQLTEYVYDMRGQLERETRYAEVSSTGEGQADGSESVRRFVYGPRGELLHSIDARAARPATLWSQDFARDSAGLSALPSSYALVQFGRLDIWSKNISGTDNYYNIRGTRTQSLGTVFRGELITGAASPTRYLRYGADNASSTGALRRHMAFYSGDGIYVTWQDNGAQNLYLGRAKDNTTYVVEVQTDAQGSTLFVYEKGANRNSGWRDRRNFADWGAARTAIELRASPSVSASSLVSIDNLSERSGLELDPEHRDSTRLPSTQPAYLTSFLYDSLGRELARVDALGNRTLTQYDDAQGQTRTTFANGRVRTLSFDASGALIARVDSDGSGTLGRTRYLYDGGGRLRLSEDPSGVRTHVLYDAAGRKVGEIDGEGALTEYAYNANDQRISVTRYATALSALALASLIDTEGRPASVALSAIRPSTSSADQRSWILYDAAGRVKKTIDALGGVIEHRYDGASQRVQTRAYATPVDVTAIGSGTLSTDVSASPSPSNADRVTRYFYDAQGFLCGTLDAEGFLTEQRYDAAGQLKQTRRYASVTTETLRAEAALTDLVMSVTATANAADQITTYLYDGKGQRVGEVDALGYLTEYRFDVAGNIVESIRYVTAVAGQALGAGILTLDGLRPTSSSADRHWCATYDALNRKISESAPDGTRTDYLYDGDGRLLASTRAADTAAARTERYRYDAQGRIIAQLTPAASTALAKLTDPQTIETFWQANAARHSYDASGRRIATVDPLGRRTHFFYDRDGRLLHTVNAEGEVRTTRYDAFGQVSRAQSYRGRITAEDLRLIFGGLTSSSVETLIGALSTGSLHRFAYDNAGHVLSDTDALDVTRRFSYNTFGEVVRGETPVDTKRSTIEAHSYDRRGLRIGHEFNPVGAPGERQAFTYTYDAFGRRVSEADAQGQVRSFSYDPLGRVVQWRNAFDQRTLGTYDAFGQSLTLTDTLGQITTYRYDLAQRRVEITTPEGVTRTTVRNEHGEILTDIDGRGGSTTTTYDADGHAVQVRGLDGASTRALYDAAGQVIQSEDARGTRTVFTYDGAGRLVQRVLDPRSDGNPSGLNLTTLYRYDTEGRAIWTRDAGGIWTQTEFDLNGQVRAVTRDPKRGPDAVAGQPEDRPQGLNLRTETAYDAAGHVLTLIEGAGSPGARKTQYAYDLQGRRVEARVDPEGLNLTTRYTYDARGNLVRRIDAAGNLTRYAYDAENRLIYTLDTLGQVSRRGYDAQGRLIEEQHYANTISVTVNLYSLSDIETALRPDTTQDRVTRRVLDADGRLRYRIDALGNVTGFTLDANGNVLRETRYANAVTLTGRPGLSDVASALRPSATQDRINRHVYDTANRECWRIDALGYVSAWRYDASGNVTEEMRYANAVTLDQSLNPTAEQVSAALTADGTQDRRLRHVYDTAQRRIASIDALGYVTTAAYDAQGNVLSETRYLNSLGANQTLADVRPDNARDSVTRHTYDTAGREIATARRIDANREALTTRVVDALGQVTSTTDALGNSTVFAYDRAGREVLQVDALGYVSARRYNALGVVTQSIRYANAVVGPWDAQTLPQIVDVAPTSSTAPIGPYVLRDASRDQVSTLTVDDLGRTVRSVDAEGGVESFTYNAFGDKASFTNKAGGRFDYTYDVLGQLTQERLPVSVPDAQGQSQPVLNRYTYNTFGDKVSQTEAVGLPEARTLNFSYDALGRLLRKALPAITVYNPTSNTFTNNVRPTETWDYDGANNVIRYVDANGNVTLSHYDALNRKVALNTSGVLITYAHDAQGNVIRERRFANAVQQGANAPRNPRRAPEVLSVTPADASNGYYVLADTMNDRTVFFTYDALNRQTGTRIEAITVYVYEGPRQYRIATADVVTTTTYDANGHVLTQTDANGNVTRHLYDRAGHEVALVDAARYITTWNRDGQGNLLTQTRFANALSANLNLTDTTTLAQLTHQNMLTPSAQDRITQFAYDRLGRKVRETLKNVQGGSVNATTGALTESTGDATSTFEYTALSQIARATNAVNATVDYGYDVLGRKTREQSAAFIDAAGNTSRLITDTEYNGLGLITRKIMRGQHNNDRLSATQYDAAGRVVLETDAAGQATRVNRDAQGNITQKTLLAIRDALGNTRDEATRYRYDSLNRQTHAHDVGTGLITESRYNAFGEVDAARSYVGGEPTWWNEFTLYDRAGRAWKSNAQDGITLAYVFDANGNATLKIDSATTDLAPLSLREILTSAGINQTVSVFDARNRLIDVYEPSIESQGQHAVISASQTGQSVFIGTNSMISFDPIPSSTAATSVDVSQGGAITAPAGAVSFRMNFSYNYNSTGAPNRLDLAVDQISIPNLSSALPGTRKVNVLKTTTDMRTESGSASIELVTEMGLHTVRLASGRFDAAIQHPNYWQTKFDSNAAMALPSRVYIINQSSKASRVLMAYRSKGLPGSSPWRWLNTSPVLNTSGALVSGWFAFDSAALAGYNYDIVYLALDSTGQVLNKQGGSLDLRNLATPVVQQSGSGAGPALFSSDNTLHLINQRDANSLTLRYRVRGSGAQWTTQPLTPASLFGATTLGWFSIPHLAYFQPNTQYEVDFVSRSGTAVINCLRAEYFRDASGVASLSDPRPYSNNPITLTFTERTDTRYVWLKYRPAGSSADFTGMRIFPTTAGSGRFSWNATELVPDPSLSTEIEIRIEAYGEHDLLSNLTRTTLRLGQRPSTGNPVVEPVPAWLIFAPRDPRTASVRLVYRNQAEHEDYRPLESQRSGGDFIAQLADSDVNAPDKTAYEYLYDAFDDQGVLLGRERGIYAVGGQSASNARLEFVVQDLTPTEVVIHRAQVFNAFGEVIAETDGELHITESVYNTQGALIEKRSPQTKARLANGLGQDVRPTTRYIHDWMGRVIGTVDPNGNLRTQVWRAGDTTSDLILERAADDGLTRHRYDYFGAKRFSVNALWSGSGSEAGYVTEYRYDAMGRVIEMRLPERLAKSPGNDSGASVRAIETFAYDGAGRRIRHTNALGFADTTAFDTLGRVIRTVSAQGFSTLYTYSYRADLTGVGGKTVSGWQKTTTDAVGRTLIDLQDSTGRTTWHQDLGGHQFTFGYDHAGHLTLQTSTTTQQRIVRTYYANGLLQSIWDQVSGAYTRYAYDKVGNRTYEGHVTLNNPTDLKAGVREHHQYAELGYDELNRLISLRDPRAKISYEYDANGNTRHILSIYTDGVDATLQTQDFWYTYDRANRFTIAMGLFAGTAATSVSDATPRIGTGRTGVALAYNALGQRVQVINSYIGNLEDYTYSADGYLIDTRVRQGPDDPSAGVLRHRQIDLAGRVEAYTEYDANDRADYTLGYRYDLDGRLLAQMGSEGNVSFLYYDDATDSTSSEGGAGALAHSVSLKDGTTVYNTNTYTYWDTPQTLQVTRKGYNPEFGDRNARWMPGSASHAYDANGHLLRVTDAGRDGQWDSSDDRILRYSNNAQGLILTREEAIAGSLTRRHHYYYANGNRVGDVGNDGPERVDYVRAIARRAQQRDYAHWSPTSTADFDQNYEPVGPNYPGPTPGRYTVRAGDTLQSIAALMWGDRSLWIMLAEANALSGSETLVQGQVLSVPNKLTNIHHNASTFRVYQPGEAMGDTAPTLPPVPPPPEDQCGFAATIVIIVVTAVVTYYTAGLVTSMLTPAAGAGVLGGAAAAGAVATAGTTASVVGAVAGAAAGSIAGQLTGMALGVQEKFSWAQVGISALSAGVTHGITGQARGGFFAAATKAAVASMITQAISVKLGLQEKFSWTQVAAAGVGAGVSAEVNDAVGQAQYGERWADIKTQSALGLAEANTGHFLARALLSNAAASVARTEVYRRPFNLAEVATEAFGDTARDYISGRYASDETNYARVSRNGIAVHLASETGGADSWKQYLSDATMTDASDPGMEIEAPTVEVVGKRIHPERDRQRMMSRQALDTTAMQIRESARYAQAKREGDLAATQRINADAQRAASALNASRFDSMGQPLNGRSNYDTLAQFGKIMRESRKDPLGMTVGKLWDWFTYTVPDADQRRTEMRIRVQDDPRYAHIDQMRESPLGALGWTIANQAGASRETQKLWLDLGTGADGLVQAVTALTGRAPAFTGAKAMPQLNTVRLETPDGLFSAVARQLIANRFGETIRPHLRTIEMLDTNAQVGYRGSLARGTKGHHKADELFNPFNFDIDAFIVSDKLAARFQSKNPIRFRSADQIPEIQKLQSALDSTLRNIPEFAGMRPDPFTFRVLTSAEISRLRSVDDPQTILSNR